MVIGWAIENRTLFAIFNNKNKFDIRAITSCAAFIPINLHPQLVLESCNEQGNNIPLRIWYIGSILLCRSTWRDIDSPGNNKSAYTECRAHRTESSRNQGESSASKPPSTSEFRGLAFVWVIKEEELDMNAVEGELFWELTRPTESTAVYQEKNSSRRPQTNIPWF